MKIQKKWLGLLSIIPATAMIFIDQSVLPVALPTIQKELLATPNEIWWAINSYLFLSALCLLFGGKLGVLLGYRKVFLIGMFVFALASILSGLSQNMFWLIGSRGLQGVGAALMIPTSPSLLMSLFPQKERGRASGINVSVSSLFLITGPLLGGYLTHALSWRWIFYINIPISVLGFFLVLRFIPQSEKREHPIDLKGFASFALLCSALIILIMQESQWGWHAYKTYLFLWGILIGGYCLFKREKSAKHPFIDLSLFRHPIYTALNLSIFATQFVLMITVYRAVFFQEGLDWSSMKSGGILCLSSLPILFLSPIGGFLADRFSPRLPLSLGFILLISSFFYLSFFIKGSLAEIFIGLLTFSAGIPLIFTPSYAAAMGTVSHKKAGIAFGILATTRAFSGTLGVAIISAMTVHTQEISFKTMAQENSSTEMLSPSFLEKIAKKGPSLQEFISINQENAVLQIFKASQVEAFSIIHRVMGFVLIFAFIGALILYKKAKLPPPNCDPETPAEGWNHTATDSSQK